MQYTIKTSKKNLVTTDEDDLRNFIDECLNDLESGKIYFLNVMAKTEQKFIPDKPFWEKE